MCDKAPAWLPPIRPMNGVWAKDQVELYAIFKEAFLDNQCFFDDKPIWPDKTKLEDDIEEGFWHVITKDYTLNARLIDPRRAERLSWIKYIIENYKDAAIKCWVSQHNEKQERVYVWLEDCDFLVVLEPNKKNTMYFLVTAFYVDNEYNRKKYSKRYDERLR